MDKAQTSTPGADMGVSDRDNHLIQAYHQVYTLTVLGVPAFYFDKDVCIPPIHTWSHEVHLDMLSLFNWERQWILSNIDMYRSRIHAYKVVCKIGLRYIKRFVKYVVGLVRLNMWDYLTVYNLYQIKLVYNKETKTIDKYRSLGNGLFKIYGESWLEMKPPDV